jgi:hypothetical protein
VATGIAASYEASTAMRFANAQLLTLCAALTVDTNVFWEILQPPQPSEHRRPLPSAEDPTLEQHAQDHEQIWDVTPSDLATKAVETMEADADVTGLVAALYHARTIERTTPSLALVMYVSVVEAIGARFFSQTRCKCCDKCDKSDGYSRQFRQALRLVLPSKDAKRLGKLYGKRSRTAHQGALHGTEFRLTGTRNTFVDDSADTSFIKRSGTFEPPPLNSYAGC